MLASIALGYVERRAGNFETALECVNDAQEVIGEELPLPMRRYVSARALEEEWLIQRAEQKYEDAVRTLELAQELYRRVEEALASR